MTRSQLSRVFRLDPIAKGSRHALVVMLHDRGASAMPLESIATRWATAVPTTAFIALDAIGQLEPGSLHLTNAFLDSDTELALIDRATRNLEPVLEDQLRAFRLHADRLVFVGF